MLAKSKKHRSDQLHEVRKRISNKNEQYTQGRFRKYVQTKNRNMKAGEALVGMKRRGSQLRVSISIWYPAKEMLQVNNGSQRTCGDRTWWAKKQTQSSQYQIDVLPLQCAAKGYLYSYPRPYLSVGRAAGPTSTNPLLESRYFKVPVAGERKGQHAICRLQEWADDYRSLLIGGIGGLPRRAGIA